VVTVRGGDGVEVTFKQIAGLIARRIVFNYRQGDSVQRGQRVGLIKFGSRVDVLLPAEARLLVKVGERVQGGSSVLAALPEAEVALAMPAVEAELNPGILPEPALGEIL